MTLKWSLTLSLLAAAACGGVTDTAAPTPSPASASLTGMVVEVDDQTEDRSGVEVTVLETCETVTTEPDGRFSFRGLPAGSVTLEFGRSFATLARQGGDDGNDDNGNDHDGTDDNGTDDDGGDDDDGGNDDTGSEADDSSSGTGGQDDDGDENEDGQGNPRIPCLAAGDDIEVQVAMSGDDVSEFSVSCSDRLRADARLRRDTAAPDADVEGKVRVESRADREKFTVEVENLNPGTVVEVFLDAGTGFVSIGTVAALSDGEAELERNTRDGDSLPLGATDVGELGGVSVEVRLAATGETLLTGEVPDLPTGVPAPLPGGRARAKARLSALVAGLKGRVEIRRRPEHDQVFKMEAEHLAPGEQVAFLIEDPDVAGTFIQLASAAADDGGEAEISTQDGLPVPLGVGDVEGLVGLEVRVIRDDGSDELLLAGRIPALVAD